MARIFQATSENPWVRGRLARILLKNAGKMPALPAKNEVSGACQRKENMYRRKFIGAGAVAMVTAIADSAPSAQRLNDVSAGGDWFTDDVKFVTSRGLMDVAGGNFNPDDNASRAVVATALYRLAGSPSVAYKPVFTDVPEGQWYSAAVIWANENGLIGESRSGGRFRPSDGITRQELAAMIFLYADIKFPQITDLDGFADKSDVSEWAETGMGWSIARELLPFANGAVGLALEPNGKLTRAQCAAALRRFVNIREYPGNIWVLNPKPTRPPVETTGLAPRVNGGWAGKTVVAMSNYNEHISASFGAEIEAQIKSSLSAGETVRLIYIGDLTVIRFQTINPSSAPRGNWEYMGYEAFLAGVEVGEIKPDAVIVGGGF